MNPALLKTPFSSIGFDPACSDKSETVRRHPDGSFERLSPLGRPPIGPINIGELGPMQGSTGPTGPGPEYIHPHDLQGYTTQPTVTFEDDPLTTLRVIFECGPKHGMVRDIEDRDVREITYGIHRHPHLAILERYKRTIGNDIRTGRVIFRFAGSETRHFEKLSGIRTALRRILIKVGLMEPTVLVDL